MEERAGERRGVLLTAVAPLSPILSPLVPRKERGFVCREACAKVRF
jgi:hypothetical protein